MNYKELVLNSLSKDNRQHIDRYFYREYKKAEKEYYEYDEFFDGCQMIIDEWKAVFKRWQHEELMECNKALVVIAEDRMTYPDRDGQTKEEQRAESKKYWKAEFERRRQKKHIYNINFPISKVLGENGIRGGHWNYKSIENLELEILKAKAKVLIEKAKEKIKEQSISKPKPKLKGFKTNLELDQIKSLCTKLKGSFIDQDTTEDNFVAAFTDEPYTYDGLVWCGKSKRLLAYFIKHLPTKSHSPEWVKASEIFRVKNNLQQSLDAQPYPKGYESIDKIINDLG